MKRTARLSILLAGCWVLVMAAAGCISEQESARMWNEVQEAVHELEEAQYRLQPHPLAVFVEEGLAKRCTAADNPDLSSTNEKDPSQNYYVRYNNKFIRMRALVVNARMADKKEPPITLGGGSMGADIKKFFERQGFAIQSADGFEPPDYAIQYQMKEVERAAIERIIRAKYSDEFVCQYYLARLTGSYASSASIYSGQGKLLYEMPWHRNFWGVVNFLKAQMIKGEIDLKSEKYDAVIEALRYSEVGQDEQALALLNKAVELDGKFLLARNERCKFFLAKGRWDDAIKETSEILKNPSLSDPKARLACYRERGALYYGTEAFDAALKDFERVLALDPKDVGALQSKGWALLEMNELGKAADAFEFALALDPDNMDAVAGRGWVLAKKQKYAEALKEFDRGQAAQNRATRGHVYCYKMLGEKEKARAALADVLEGAATWPKCPLFERKKAEMQEWAKELE